MIEFKITNGDLTYKVKQVGEYAYTVKNGRKHLRKIDSLNKNKTTKFWTIEAISKLQAALNMWIKEY